MRIIIDSVLEGIHIRAAIDALEHAHIPYEAGAEVEERTREYGVILIKSDFAKHAVEVLQSSGIGARLD